MVATATMNTSTTLTQEQQEQNARAYILALKSGTKPASMPDVGKWLITCTRMAKAFDDEPNGLEEVIRAYIASGKFPDLDRLLSENVAGQEYVEEEPVQQTTIIPELDKAVRTPQNFDLNSSEAYRFLLKYVDFSKENSPEGYEDFHLFCGLWMLSVVAARRVYVWMGQEKIYTNLRIALCAESTAHAKSMTAKVAISCLQNAGLQHLLIRRGKITAEKLVQNMAGQHIRGDFSELDANAQKQIEKNTAMAGQKGMYWDELGKFLKSMLKENSPMTAYQDLLLQLEDCVTNGNDTVTRGDDTIEKPYLSILGSLVPQTMKSAARTGSELWGDGFFARCNFVCAPETEGIDAPLATGRKPTPLEIITGLQQMNEWLGEAEVEITMDEKSKKTSIKILRGLPEVECTFSPEATKAMQAYRSTLKRIRYSKDVPVDLRASYVRLATTALRFAMLLATLEASKNPMQTTIPVSITHWRVAQKLTEILRQNLHVFYQQVNNHKTFAASMENEINAAMQRHFQKHETMTANDIRRLLNDKYATKEINDVLQSLKHTTLEWEASTHSTMGKYRLRRKMEGAQ